MKKHTRSSLSSDAKLPEFKLIGKLVSSSPDRQPAKEHIPSTSSVSKLPKFKVLDAAGVSTITTCTFTIRQLANGHIGQRRVDKKNAIAKPTEEDTLPTIPPTSMMDDAPSSADDPPDITMEDVCNDGHTGGEGKHSINVRRRSLSTIIR